MIDKYQPVSAYLVQPTPPRSRRLPDWQRARSVTREIRQANPHLIGRSLTALAIWCALVSTYQGFTSQPAPHVASTAVLAAAPSELAGRPNTPATVKPVAVTAAIHASVLPSGPSGQLLPPGTMAPDYAYANSYAHGQCTWYVAGRRQIPSNWGNAKTWYYHASASGWSVGTVPAVAAIAWTPAGAYGHVALVEQVSPDGASVYVSEMNYRGLGVKSFRWAPASSFKYIY